MASLWDGRMPLEPIKVSQATNCIACLEDLGSMEWCCWYAWCLLNTCHKMMYGTPDPASCNIKIRLKPRQATSIRCGKARSVGQISYKISVPCPPRKLSMSLSRMPRKKTCSCLSWSRNLELMKEMKPTRLLGDNQSALKMAKSPANHSKLIPKDGWRGWMWSGAGLDRAKR